MWMRFEAMTRRPASSSILVTAPGRLRRVASGLMIEKVRVTAVESSRFGGGIGRAPSRTGSLGQGSGLFDPASLLQRPIVAIDAFAARQQLPCQAGALQRCGVEQVERAII